MIGSDTATVSLARGSQSGYMQQGQILHIFLQVVTDLEASGTLSSYWFIDRVDTTTGGVETLQLSACPVDSQNRSLLALAAVEHRNNAPGMTLPYPPTGVDDVPGRSTDTSVPPSSTSGTPFTEGGGGITGPLSGIAGFNLSRRGNSGGGSGPADPPGDGATQTPIPPGEVPIPGDDPKKPDEDKGQTVVENWNNAFGCKYGVKWMRFRVRGVAGNPGGVPLYYDQSVTTSGWIMAVDKGEKSGPMKLYEIFCDVVNPETGEVISPNTMIAKLGDYIEPPFNGQDALGYMGRLRLIYQAQQCKTKDSP
jgi:hypothetical protein